MPLLRAFPPLRLAASAAPIEAPRCNQWGESCQWAMAAGDAAAEAAAAKAAAEGAQAAASWWRLKPVAGRWIVVKADVRGSRGRQQVAAAAAGIGQAKQEQQQCTRLKTFTSSHSHDKWFERLEAQAAIWWSTCHASTVTQLTPIAGLGSQATPS